MRALPVRKLRTEAKRGCYAICLTATGVLAFDYRGNAVVSTPGQVGVLHPDEVHDGYAGTQEGFG